MTSLRDELAQHLEPRFTDVHVERLSRFGAHRRGKVRDIFVGDDEIVMVTTDRLSAFDVVLTAIPCKGAILNGIARYSFDQTEDICPNHLIDSPHPNVLRVQKAEPLPIEVIVRRYIAGSLWRDYEDGTSGAYEIDIPTGLRRHERFDTPLLTPSTKAESGTHDEPISRRAILEGGLVSEVLLEEAYDVAMKLFLRGEALAVEQGLILVDTKYELGTVDGKLIVIDEIHTADSSRYWEASEYDERFAADEPQKMLDKENIRQWLIARGYKGDGTPPEIPDDVRLDLAEIYANLYHRLLGKPFEVPTSDPRESVYTALGV